MKKVRDTMHSYGQVQLRLANERIRERLEEASRARLIRRVDRSSVRRSVGNSMIRLGQRLAAEPSTLVRSGAISR